MLKRSIAWVLALALVLSVLPLGVLAEGEKAIPDAHSHSAAQHDCEHCDGTITWTAWTKTTSLPTTTGHYYLTADVKPTAQAKITGTNDVTLCLNGYTVSGESYTSTMYYVQDTGKLTISDCTAYTDADGVLHAGTITKGSAGGAMSGAIYAKNNCAIALYNCIFTANKLNYLQKSSDDGKGGTVQLRGDKAGTAPTLYMENVVFDSNTSGASAGAVCVHGSKTTPVFTAKNCTFKNNTAVNGGAVFLTATNATFTGCTFEGNTSKGGSLKFGTDTVTTKTLVGGTIRLLNATVTLDGCTIEGNTAKEGGAIYAESSTVTVKNTKILKNAVTADGAAAVQIKASTATVEGSQIQENTATGTGGSAFYIHGGNSKVTLKDTTVTGNKHTGTSTGSRAGVYVTNTTDKLFLEGVVVIQNNMVGTGEAAFQRDVFVQNNGNAVDVGGLTAGSSMTIYANWAPETPNFVTAATAPAAWDENWILCERTAQKVDYNETDGFHYYVEPEIPTDPVDPPEPPVPEEPPVPDHKHCQCGAAECTDTRCEAVEYSAWDNATALPTAGNYYLTVDVNLAAETAISGDLNLCLNGHTVTGNGTNRHISTTKDQKVTVVISDCTAKTEDGVYTAGKFTGGVDQGKNASGGSIYIRAGGTLKIFDGIFENNTSDTAGGAISVVSGTTLLITGGVFRNNTAVTKDGKTYKAGGAININGSISAHIENVTITGNAGANGAGVYATKATKLTIQDSVISGNSASGNGGGVAAFTTPMDLVNVTITDNTSKKDGAGAYMSADQMNITDCYFSGNDCATAGGAICYGGNSTGTVTGTTVEKNEAGGGAGFMVQNGAVVTVKNSTVSDNTASGNAGGFRIYKATLTLENVNVIGNTADEGAGLNVETTSKLTLKNSTVTDNIANGTTAGVKVDSTSGLTLAGKAVITGNKGGNLLLVGGIVMDVTGMTDGSEIQISADMGPISTPCADLTGYFRSESVYRGVVYRDGVLYMATDGSHKHCYCFGADAGCDHEILEWTAWESTNSLPTSGHYYLLSDVTLTAEQSISSDVSICLNGHTVKAASGKRHISTVKDSGASIVLCDCTAKTEKGVYTAGMLTGGVDKSGNTGGGSIYVRAGSELTIYDGIICDNYSTLVGGALAFNGASKFTMVGGQISGNKTYTTSVDENGEEVVTWKEGGAIYITSGNDVKILGGTICDNEGLGGGGIRFAGTGKLLIAGGTISGNIGHGQGGGIFASSATVTITGGTITGNHSTSSAGGLCLGTNAVATMSGGKIDGNTAPSGAGMIVQGGATLALSGGSITNNKSSGTGGGIGMYSKAQLTMTGGSICDNTSVKNGAGIYANAAYVDMQGGEIKNNTAGKDGAGIYVNAKGNVDISGTALVSGNVVTSGSGGGISYGSTSTGKISGGVIEKNKGSGGGGLMIQNTAVVEITGGEIKNNTATGSNGGGIWVYKATLTMSGGTLSGNKALKTSGGGLSATSESTLTITGGTVKNNSAKTTGGGISVNKCTANISGVTVTNNSCERDGAGIYNTAGVMNIRGGVVSAYNYTKGNGGGFCYGSKSSGYISGISVYGNKVDGGGGGAIIQNQANVTIGYASFSGNTCKKTGAGIYLYKANLTMSGGSLTNNVATGSGGGLYATDSGDVKLSNVTVSGNSGKSGGGLYMYRTKVFAKDCSIIENQAPGSGAGVYSSGGTHKAAMAGGSFTNVKFIGNQGTDSCSGGAVYMNTDVEFTFTDCQISDNVSANYCGGIYAAAGSVPTLTNCTFTGNQAAKYGGALCTGDSGYVTNCYFADNKAQAGGAIFGGNYMERWAVNGWGSKREFEIGLYITDCVFENNDAETTGGGFHLDMSAYTTMDNCTFTGNTAGTAGSAMWLLENCTMTNVTATGNVCANNGHAVVLADSEFDGQTYINGLFKMGGDMIIKDNEGGDLYLDYKTTIGALAQGYSPKTEMHITLDEGYLTQRVGGAYNYEGGNLQYVLTYGDRSVTEPEYDASMVVKVTEEQTQQKNATGDILLYAGIGLVALAAIAGAAFVIGKKKKSAGAETK